MSPNILYRIPVARPKPASVKMNRTIGENTGFYTAGSTYRSCENAVFSPDDSPWITDVKVEKMAVMSSLMVASSFPGYLSSTAASETPRADSRYMSVTRGFAGSLDGSMARATGL